MELNKYVDFIQLIVALIGVMGAIIGYSVAIYIKKKKSNKDDTIILGSTGEKPSDPIGWLIISSSLSGNAVYPLEMGRNDIGRFPQSKYNSITLIGHHGVDMYMSRFHFTIIVLQQKNGEFQYFLFDEISTNGTYVNGELVGTKTIELTDNSKIKTGETTILFKEKLDPKELNNIKRFD